MSRVFKEVTGHSVIEYINLRRLSLSLEALSKSNNNIEFIANEFGYGTRQSYIKAFKKFFSITPATYKRNPIELEVVDRFNTGLLQRCGNGVIVFPKIKMVPAFQVAGILHEIKASENIFKETGMKLAADFFFKESKRIKNPVSYKQYIGFSPTPGYETAIISEEQCVYYMPSIIVNDDSIIPENMLKKQVKSGKYAVFKYVGIHNVLHTDGLVFYNIWDYILEKWLPTVNYIENNHCCYEHIDYERCDDYYCEISFYLPII